MAEGAWISDAPRPAGLACVWRATPPSVRAFGFGVVLSLVVGSAYWLGATLTGERNPHVYSLSLAEGWRSKLSPPPPTPADVRKELECLALNIYHEARGEPETGKLAVGHVVMNRVSHAGFPETVCGVIRQGGEQALHRCQFSWWCDGKSDRPTDKASWMASQDLARYIYWGRTPDPTGGALWYHAIHVKPAWRKALVKERRIGRHIFYRQSDRPAQLASHLGQF